ncbi:hypothetical protein [Draconibacterium halophilum]|uniref:Universal stress protein family protein n=1 Tax=Draconibacterium halophilum TaxID=2706887 RepID=A0A6C0RG25_9BACT|nr:hypothetical protein [Draconibacterium halophilum]QIA09089.1 hypothetical protein G0Q07_15810 [Draconibacterium halophilum]
MEMSARLNNQPSILILADFSDGSWHATSFAMRFLYHEKSPVTILQTYQNPGWGHLMMRKLSHHLKKITKNELRALKNRLLEHFKVEKQKINTLSIEGELNSVLNYKPIINGHHNIVLSTYSSFKDSCKRQNGCLEKIIDTAENPLFILPETFEGDTSKKILFVGPPEKKPSEQLCNQLVDICKKTQSKLEVLFVVKTQNKKVSEDIQSYYHEYCEGIDITFSTIQNKTKCKGIKNYMNDTNRDLIVIEND